MNKPVKGVMPAKQRIKKEEDTVRPIVKDQNEKVDDHKTKTFTPVKRTKQTGAVKPVTRPAKSVTKSSDNTETKNEKTTTATIQTNNGNSKVIRTPNKEELDYIIEAITNKMTEVFVTRKEVKEVITQVLQEMVVENSNVSSK